MKKFFALAATVFLGMGVVGCEPKPAPTEPAPPATETPAETPAETEKAPE